MSEQKVTRENRYQFWRIVIIYLICLFIIFVAAGLLITKFFFTGISEEDIQTDVEKYTVSYQVVAITTDVKDDNSVGYKVGFADKNKIDKVEEFKDNYAPDIESNMQVLPTGMSIGVCYDAEWVKIVARYSGSTVSKDIVSMQYTNQPITDMAIEEAKGVVSDALVVNLRNYVRDDAFKMLAILCGISIVLGIVGVFIIDKRMAKHYKCTYWEEVMHEYRDIERTVIDNANGEVNYAEEKEQLFHNNRDNTGKRVGGFNMDKMVTVSRGGEGVTKAPNIQAVAASMGYGVPKKKPVGYSEEADITGTVSRKREQVKVDVSTNSPLLFDTAELALNEKQRNEGTEQGPSVAPVFNNTVAYDAVPTAKPVQVSSEEFKPKHKNPFANAKASAPVLGGGDTGQMVNIASNVFTAQNPFSIKEESTEVVVDKDNISGAINGAEMKSRKKV